LKGKYAVYIVKFTMVQMEGLVWLVGLKLRLVSWLALTKYRCEFDNLNCISAITPILKSRPVSIG